MHNDTSCITLGYCVCSIFARNGTLFAHYIGDGPTAMVTAGPKNTFVEGILNVTVISQKVAF